MLKAFPSKPLLCIALQWCWPYTYALSQVCKAFAMVVRRREYWQTAIAYTLARCLPGVPLSLRQRVNPFFRFPAFVPDSPLLTHWGQWLMWIKDPGRLLLREEKRNSYGLCIRLQFYHPASSYADGESLVFYESGAILWAFWCNRKPEFKRFLHEPIHSGPSTILVINGTGHIIWSRNKMFRSVLGNEPTHYWVGAMMQAEGQVGMGYEMLCPNLECGRWESLK